MRAKLRLSDDLRLPIDAVTQRISILGRTRTGKSYTSGVLVEEVLKARQQVVIVDPKGDWWGLRSSADGKRAGLPITIMGGKHGDVPLEPTAGALVADIIIKERISVVLDLSLFESKADEVRFMTAFLDRLYRKNTEPILLVIDEADVFAPQKPEKNETVMLNRMETICRRGAGRGIGVVLISQRSAAIHKGCLSQTELMVAHQTTAPQDKDAIKGWVVDHDDEDRRDDFMNRITKLKKGCAIVWSPSWLEIYREVVIRRKETYDSSDSPRVGRRRKPPKILAQVDLERLKKHMAETIEQAKREDPRALLAEIQRLKAQLAAKPKIQIPEKVTLKKALVEKIVERVVEVPVVGKREIRKLEKLVKRVETAKSHLGFTAQSLEISTRDIVATIQRMSDRTIVDERRKSVGLPPVKEKKPVPVPLIVRPTKADRIVKSTTLGLDKAESAVLSVLFNCPDGCTIGKLALLAGYRVSGGFKNTLAALRSHGYMEGANTGIMKATDDGMMVASAYAEALPTGPELVDFWLENRSFDTAGKKVLKVLVDRNPDALDIGELAEASGYKVSGGFKNTLADLRTAGVLVGRNTERMRLSDELQEALGVGVGR